MPSSFRPNKNFLRELASEGDYLSGLAQAAKPAVEAVRQAAPNVTGYYARSIELAVEDGEVRIQSTDPFAHLIEYGSANNPPYAPLRRGIRAAGLKFKEADR